MREPILYNPIKYVINIAEIMDRVTPKNHHIMPYFEKAYTITTITYNDGFKIEHKTA